MAVNHRLRNTRVIAGLLTVHCEGGRGSIISQDVPRSTGVPPPVLVLDVLHSQHTEHYDGLSRPVHRVLVSVLVVGCTDDGCCRASSISERPVKFVEWKGKCSTDKGGIATIINLNLVLRWAKDRGRT